MSERRSQSTRCPDCASTQVQLGSKGGDLVYTCRLCGRQWAERRLSTIIQHDSQRRDDAARQAVAAVCAARELESLMEATRHWARRLTGADGVSFILRAGEHCFYAAEDAISPLWKGQRFPMDDCVSGWAMRHKQSVLIPDIYADPRVPHAAYRPTFVKSLLIVPVRKSDPIAAIGAYWQTLHAPSHDQMQLMELLAEAAAVRLVSEQLWVRVQDAIT